MTTLCPHCQSSRVVTKDVAKKTCGYLGMVGRAASGTAGLLSGAELGGAVGIIAGPGGALLGAVVGAATGGVAGATLGEAIDERVLDNYGCLDSGHVFSQRES